MSTTTITQSNIPTPLLEFINDTIGHDDYAPYVLDRQSAKITGEADDWHDVLVTVEGSNGLRVTKFTMRPDGGFEHYAIDTESSRS